MSTVSVVMPARDAERTIGASIRSVLDQEAVGEVIVVDDGSRDRTATEALLVGDRRLRVVEGDRRGVAAALNRGFAAATGDHVARCDADDLFPPGRLAWQRAWLDDHPDFVAVSGGFRTMSPRGMPVADLACDVAEGDVTAMLLDGTGLTTFCAWLTRRSALREVGGAREWFATAEDIDLMFRLAAVGRVWHRPTAAYLYRLHDASITHRQPGAQRLFYEASAAAFARERSRTGSDPLQRGDAPAPPAAAGGRAMTASEQMAGQLTGVAWQAHAAGERRAALRTAVRALAVRPGALAGWKSLLLIALKPMSGVRR